VSDVAAAFGCSSAAIYAVLGRLRREAAAPVLPLPVQAPLALDETATVLERGGSEPPIGAPITEAAASQRRASARGGTRRNRAAPAAGPPNLEFVTADEGDPAPSAGDAKPGPGPVPADEGLAIAGATMASSAAPVPRSPNAADRFPIGSDDNSPKEGTVLNVVAFGTSTSGASTASGNPVSDRRRAGGVGAKLAKPGYGLVMRTVEGEETVRPFRSLDELLSAVRPILRAAATSADPVWFSLQPIDLASTDMDAA